MLDSLLYECPGLVKERRIAKEDRKYPCHFCPEFFVDKKMLSSHINNCHDSKKPFVCNICNKAFLSNSGLVCHNLATHEHTGFQCIYNGCSKEFTTRQYMMTHYKTVHLKAKDYKCPTCGVLFGQNSSLRHHIRAVHEGKHPYKCDHQDCTKSFTRADDLWRHIDTVHLAVKSYVCQNEGCGKQR